MMHGQKKTSNSVIALSVITDGMIELYNIQVLEERVYWKRAHFLHIYNGRILSEIILLC